MFDSPTVFDVAIACMLAPLDTASSIGFWAAGEVLSDMRMNETIRESPESGSPGVGEGLDQAAVVGEHFKDASTEWGARYGSAPRRMSDLDLVLRREAVDRLLHSLVAGANRTLQVFDVGCGSGDVLDGFPRDSVRVLGVDLVPEMVAVAARTHPTDRFLVGSVEHLPFPPGSADVVTCLGVLEYLPDPCSALRMMRRALRPGGHLIVSFPNRWSLFRKLTRIEVRAEQALLRTWAWLRGRTREVDSGTKYHHTSWSTREVRNLLPAAGFASDQMLLHTYGLWGIVGRFPISLGLSTWMSRWFCRESAFSVGLACTIVVRARKTDDKDEGAGGREPR